MGCGRVVHMISWVRWGRGQGRVGGREGYGRVGGEVHMIRIPGK